LLLVVVGESVLAFWQLGVAQARQLTNLAQILKNEGNDLFAGDLEHIFGWGSLDRRVGVMSLFRTADGPDEQTCRSRVLALAAHEAGHMLSIPHCVFFGCLMNGARTLEEADARPKVLCPVCRAKLCWNLGIDPKARYRALREAYERAGVAASAAAVRAADDATPYPANG
jgi:archaemetzincin